MSMSAIFILFVYFYPKASNLSLEEIDGLFIKPGKYDGESTECKYTPPVKKADMTYIEKS